VTSPIGVARPRPDAPAKVRGATRYAADRRLYGLLYARLVLATHAHARIAGIDAKAALAMPGVVAVLAASDLPITATGRDRLSVPLARTEVVFAGQPVAIVVADSEAAAEDAVELVDVRLEPLPLVLDAEAAMDPAAPLAWQEIADEGDDPARWTPRPTPVSAAAATNRSRRRSCPRTSPAKPLLGGRRRRRVRGATVVRSGRFTTSWVHQGYLEPQACTAWVDPDGTLVLESATQALFGSRDRGRQGARARPAPGARHGTPLGGASAASGHCSTRSSPPPRSSSAAPSGSRSPGPRISPRRTRASRSSRSSASPRMGRAGSSRSSAG
jgi:CO/xanthine dehydrogenase Mo-binding subunit